MIFNGIEKDFVRVRIDLFRPPTPPIEFFTQPNRKGGSRVTKKRFTDAILPVPVLISDSDRTVEELKEEMTDWLVHPEIKKLAFKDMSNRYYLAEYESMELDERKYRAKGYINFYLPEAIRFGLEKTINLTTTGTNHTITGQTDTPWTIEVLFEEKTSRFEFWAGDIYLQLNYEFIVGDKLTISYTGREVWLRDIDLRKAVSMSSHFEELSPGTVSMRASHAATLKYDERYY